MTFVQSKIEEAVQALNQVEAEFANTPREDKDERARLQEKVRHLRKKELLLISRLAPAQSGISQATIDVRFHFYFLSVTAEEMNIRTSTCSTISCAH